MKYLKFAAQSCCIGLFGLVICVVLTRHSDEIFTRIDHEFLVPNYTGPALQIAVLADFHFWSPNQFSRLTGLSGTLLESKPDYILLLGDYIERSANWDHAASEIVTALGTLNLIAPTFAVLGNHENDRGRDDWINAFEASDITLLENELWQGPDICLRGRTDIQSGQYQANLPIPVSCLNRTLSFTHSPSESLWSAHQLDTPTFFADTHCGQITLPILGSLLDYKNLPKPFHCGAFEFEGMPSLVTGGLGSSTLPIRSGQGTQPRWELVTLKAANSL